MMLAMASSERSATKASGRLGRALLRLLMKRAAVVAVERLADRFRLITLEGAALAGVTWTPGQKIQIAMGSAFVARTYTPITWDADAGRTCVLGCVHGNGPGSAWVGWVEPGDECHIFGPRTSLDARRLAGSLAVFGDETSIGLAAALAVQDKTRSITCHFEVADVESGRKVVQQLGFDNAVLFAKRADDAHLQEMEAALPALVAAGASFVLTGKAGTIQRLRRSLRQQAVAAPRIVTKAYWAPGKTGLD
ncbi:siderophore-interacting protein [Xanthobacteraceae bacterium Astr-EGSB]|uniref:siderophore-interacting protein n=1 Tax=Astrobacterium formosum TaxID=3069710 RepID=UPI0027B6F4CE|nr:siderophore-interacting protein [Xanthobacteraceae bacterium Astr-EGSB]